MLVNRFGCRRTALTGAITCVASLLLSSLPSSIALMYVTYSIPFGFGSSCLFVSSYVVISLYFDKRKAIATGIVASGTGTGVLVVAPLLQALLDNYDWRKTYRIMAGIFSVVCLLCLTFDPVVLKRKGKETEQDGEGETENLAVNHAKNDGKEEIQKKLLNFSIFKEKTFVVLTLAYTVAFLGQHAPRLHLVSKSLLALYNSKLTRKKLLVTCDKLLDSLLKLPFFTCETKREFDIRGIFH